MPEDTKSLKTGVLTASEFLAQARIAGDENIRQYRSELSQFDDGFLFYYFGNIDQVSHMMWRPMDPQHPAYNATTDAPFRSVVEDLYVGLDGIVGETMKRLSDNDLLLVMSDHGFASWRRAFNLNTWLRDNGYLVVREGLPQTSAGFFSNVDWSKTRAYALGLNGLYINLKGRESQGAVDPVDRDRLVTEIGAKLAGTIDPQTGTAAITRVFRREAVYKLQGFEDIAPDMIVGYAKGTRSSDESALGGLAAAVFENNTTAWTGDHCMDPAAVPGVLFTSRPLRHSATTLQELPGAILAELGIQGFPIAPGN
jgi:predicted AlkP superfamily phosphohydrolase/phosphomutase